MSRHRGRTYGDQMRDIANRYVEAGEPWPATARQIAAWAIGHSLWQPQRSAVLRQCADDLSRAMREEYVTDPQGRRVRAKHAARISQGEKQTTIWDDISTASPAHMRVAFQQRRQQIVGDCWQLKCDVESFNENRSPSQPIQMVFDFTQDMAERELVESAAA